MDTTRPAVGSQTLARGLRALELVASARDGVSIQEIADQLDIHRSMASRMLATLADFRLVLRGNDGRYRTGTGLAALAAGIHSTLRAAAEPTLHEVAAETGATVALLIIEGGEAVAVEIVEPPSSSYALSFKTGSRHPLSIAAGGIALQAALPPAPAEAARVTEARERGYAATFGEVEPGAYGVAVPLRRIDGFPTACLNLITHRAEIAEIAPKALCEAAERINLALS